ncbi:kinetochore-associated protein Dsn1/Mis13, partial [Piptocephalis cylindrospora]
ITESDARGRARRPRIELSDEDTSSNTHPDHPHTPSPRFRRSRAKSPISSRDALVPLPTSETPIIQRNRQMRQTAPPSQPGPRRASLTRRGKRTSSIQGFISQPHEDVPVQKYYRHIEADLPDPVRMRHLLAWCGRKALDQLEGSSPDIFAMGKEAIEDVLHGLSSNTIDTSWYERSPTTTEIKRKRKPHPENVANEEKRHRLMGDLKDLQKEEALWLGELRQREEELERQERLDMKEEGYSNIILDKEDQATLDSLSQLYSPENEVGLDEDPSSWTLPSLGQSVRAAERITQSGEHVAASVIQGAHARTPVPGAKIDPIDLLRILTRVGRRKRSRA